MSNPSAAVNSAGASAKDKFAGQDEQSDATPPTGFKPKANDQEMMSKVLKFAFVYTGSTKNKVAPSVLHTHWMQAVQDAYGTEIVIINNKNVPVETVSTIKWTDPSVHTKQFQLHQKTTGRDERRQTTYFIIHRVLTDVTLRKIRALPAVQNIMKEFKFYITDHQWTENQWDTSRIGWLTNINPTYYNREQAHIKFNAILQSKLAGTTKKVKIPMFRMAFVSPTTNKDGNTVSTKAYAVEVLAEDSVQMLMVLKALLEAEKTTFVPYSMRNKYPEAYVQAIKYQTSNINKTRVVVLENISTDTMFYIGPHICALPGVIDLIADSRVDENGRHTVLVEATAFKKIRNDITQKLEGWIATHVSSDALPKAEQFAGSARVKPIYDDGMSSGANSWMSTSNASFLSMDLTAVQDHQFFNESTNIAQVFTYANITVPNTQLHPNGTAKSVATDDLTTDVTSELTEMETRQKQEIERMTEAHRIATEKAEAAYRTATLKAEQLAEEQRLEIAQLRAQRQADQDAYAQEQLIAEAKAQAQEAATSELRSETKAELQCLQDQMNKMMETFQAAVLFNTMPQSNDNKRTHNDYRNDDSDNSQSGEKRQDVRSTPGKKLFTDEMDLEDPATLQQKLSGAATNPKKQK
jgi:hypothetical protein